MKAWVKGAILIPFAVAFFLSNFITPVFGTKPSIPPQETGTFLSISDTEMSVILVIIFVLYITSNAVRRFLKPNKFNVSTTLLIGLLPVQIGNSILPALIMLPLSIVYTDLAVFSLSTKVLLITYLLSSTGYHFIKSTRSRIGNGLKEEK